MGIIHKKVSIRNISVTLAVLFIFTSLQSSLYTCETTPVCKKSPEAELPEGASPSPWVKVSSQSPPRPLSAHESLVENPYPFV